MGHWNHRVVQRTVMEFGKPVQWLSIHECFYRLSDESDAGWTSEPITVEGETLDELRETLERMLRALDKPIIVDTEPAASAGEAGTAIDSDAGVAEGGHATGEAGDAPTPPRSTPIGER